MTSLGEFLSHVGRRTALGRPFSPDVLPDLELDTKNVDSLLRKIVQPLNERKRTTGETDSFLYPKVSIDVNYLQRFLNVNGQVVPDEVVMAVLRPESEKPDEIYLIRPSSVYPLTQGLHCQDIAVDGLTDDLFKTTVTRFLTESLFFTTNINENCRPELYQKAVGFFFK